MITLINSHCLDTLREMPDSSVHCCVTSPPYWGLRDYGVDGQFGLEKTPEGYVENMVSVFREVKRVLRDDGTLWLNLGDCYNSNASNQQGAGSSSFHGGNPDRWKLQGRKNRVGGGIVETRDLLRGELAATEPPVKSRRSALLSATLKPKDLVGIPWRVAFALQADGWYLRSDIIWAKPNPMPESVTDRPTKSHEYIFLLAKSQKYYYDAEAVKEPFADERMGNPGGGGNYVRQVGKTGYRNDAETLGKGVWNEDGKTTGRNIRSVWTIPTQPFSGAKLMCDYVGSDGKPYKVSPDCPIHGRTLGRNIQKKVVCGGQLNSSLNGNLDIPNDPVRGLASVLPSSSAPANLDCEISTSLAQTTQNMNENKTVYPFDMAEPQNHLRNGRIEEKSSCSLDSLSPLCAEIATEHNNRIHKTDLALETTQPCISCVETLSRIGDKQELPLKDGHTSRIHGSNTSAGCASDEKGIDPSVQTLSRNANKASSLPPYPKGNNEKCICQVVTVDHFATFPEKLVEPCIKAGCPKDGVVLDPFMGSGTVGVVAQKLDRSFIGIELNPAYHVMAERRIGNVAPLFQEAL